MTERLRFGLFGLWFCGGRMQVDTTGFDQLQCTKSHSVETGMAGLVFRGHQMWIAGRPATSKSLSSLISTDITLERLLQKNEFHFYILLFCVIDARFHWYILFHFFIDPFILNHSKLPSIRQSNTHFERSSSRSCHHQALQSNVRRSPIRWRSEQKRFECFRNLRIWYLPSFTRSI